MNNVYALLFITSGVALLTLLALAADTVLARRKQPRRIRLRQPHTPPFLPRRADDHAPDLTKAGDLAQHLERVRSDAETRPC